MIEKICGIYGIKNKINNKYYIGQTSWIYRRFAEHKNDLRHHQHRNSDLQTDWDYYGEDNFEFLILEECLQEQLNIKEKEWIIKYNAIDNGYNIIQGGSVSSKYNSVYERFIDCASNVILTEQQVKEILVKIQNGQTDCSIAKEYHVHPNTIHNIHNKKTWKYLSENLDLGIYDLKHMIDMYTEDGQYVKTFQNARLAAKEIGNNYKDISSCCHGKIRISKGYIWRFHNHPFDEFRTTIKSTHIDSIAVDQYDLSWNFIQSFNQIADAERHIGIKGGVGSVIRGKSHTAGGYHWLRHGEKPPIKAS